MKKRKEVILAITTMVPLIRSAFHWPSNFLHNFCKGLLLMSTTTFRRLAIRNSTRRLAASLAMIATATVAFLCCTTAVQAAITTYSNEPAWQSAVPGSTLIHFDDLAPATNLSNQYPGVTFSPVSTGIPRTSNDVSAHSASNLVITYPAFNGGGDVRIAFDSPQGGVAFWHLDSEFAGNKVTLYDAVDQVLGTFDLQFPHPFEWVFLGFTSSANDISKVDIEINPADFVGLDDLQFGMVPEPSGFALAGLAAAIGLWGGANRILRQRWPATG